MPLITLLVLAAYPAAAQLRAAASPVRAAPAAFVLPAAGPGATLAAPTLIPTAPISLVPASPTVPRPATAASPRPSVAAPAPAATGLSSPWAVALPAPAMRTAPAVTSALTNAVSEEAPKPPAQETAMPRTRAAVAAGSLDSFFDGSNPMSKPPIEAWSVGGRTYDSTARLVRELPDSAEPVAASYTFGRFEAVSRGEHLANTAVGGATGLVAGGVGGALFSILGGMAGAVLGLFLFGDPSGGLAVGEAAVIAAGFSGFGALFGLIIGWAEGGKPWRGWVGGEIYRHDGRLLFRTSGDKGRVTVDLAAYAEAGRTSGPVAQATWPVWKTAGYGLALAGAAALATGFPLVQIIGLWVAGPALGNWLGKAFSARGEVKGGVLGGALGALLPVTMFLALSLGAATGDQLSYLVGWALAITGLGGVFGALFGNRVRAGLARRAADFPPEQWWSPER